MTHEDTMTNLDTMQEHTTRYHRELADRFDIDTTNPPRSPCGQLAGLALVPRHRSTDWCEAAMSGAHLIWNVAWYCEGCTWYGPTVAGTGQRHCPMGCRWSRGEIR